MFFQAKLDREFFHFGLIATGASLTRGRAASLRKDSARSSDWMLADVVPLPGCLALRTTQHESALAFLIDMTNFGVVLSDQDLLIRRVLGAAVVGWPDATRNSAPSDCCGSSLTGIVSSHKLRFRRITDALFQVVQKNSVWETRIIMTSPFAEEVVAATSERIQSSRSNLICDRRFPTDGALMSSN